MKEITYAMIEEACRDLNGQQVKGKTYIQVTERIKAFRRVYPTGRIATEIISLVDGVVTMQTTVFDEEGKILGTGFAQEKETSSYINKSSFIENCETSAVGRALGMCGFGIDTNLCSVEELVNALSVQFQEAPTKPQEMPVEAKKDEPKVLDPLYPLCKKKGVSVTAICKKYGVTDFALLTEDQRTACIEGLNGMPDKEA